MTPLPLYEVVVTAGGRLEVLTLEAPTAQAARRAALQACPWADARTQFIALRARKLDFDRHVPTLRRPTFHTTPLRH